MYEQRKSPSTPMQSYAFAGLKYAAIGAGIGGMVGFAKQFMSSSLSPDQSPSAQTILQSYKYILMDSVAIGALNQLLLYASSARDDVGQLLTNLNNLIGIQVSINEGQIAVQYPYRATTYVTSVKSSLNRIKHSLRNVSVPHLEEDIQSITQIAEDYLYNINQDVSAHMIRA